MTLIKTTYNRRSFLKSSVLAGGGMMLGFSWLASCQLPVEEEAGLTMPDEWFDINAYLKIGNNGVVTIFSPNPEFGQNVKTSMPMIVAEELDVDWKNVVAEQAPYSPERFPGAPFGQFTGGSQGIRSKWEPLRMAGASAKQMLKQAAALSQTQTIVCWVTRCHKTLRCTMNVPALCPGLTNSSFHPWLLSLQDPTGIPACYRSSCGEGAHFSLMSLRASLAASLTSLSLSSRHC